ARGPASDFTDTITPESEITYADLVRLVCPGLVVNEKNSSEATGFGCVPHRVMERKVPASTWEGVGFSELSRIPMKTLGANRVLVSFEAPDITRSLGVAL